MIYILYGCVLVGAVLLVADVLGRLVAARRNASFMRSVGVAAASLATIGPVAALLNATWSWPFPLFVAGYVVAYVGFVYGSRNVAKPRGVAVQRLAYLGYVVLVAFPSWTLLFLAPAVALAGVALVRDPQSPH